MPKNKTYINENIESDSNSIASNNRKLINKLHNIHRNDETDRMFDLGLKVQVYHIPTRTEVAFKAYITEFSDSYDPEWNSERVFGRNDPHQVFKGTERVITIGWKILAATMAEAQENMKKMSLLAQMQYPTYDSSVQGASNVGVYNANAIQASPIFRLKFMNWVQDVNAGNSPIATAKDSGLVGKMEGFKFTPELKAGVFHFDDGSIYARELQVNLTYTALHTHELGFKGRAARKGSFPYGEDIADDSAAAVSNNGRTGLSVTTNKSGKTRQQREAKVSQILNNEDGSPALGLDDNGVILEFY